MGFLSPSRKRSGSGGFLSGRRSGSRDLPSLEELQEQVGVLEAEQAQFGSPAIEQDNPGVFRTIVDLLSRPNFAIAGAFEEIAQGRSVAASATRATAEIFSGFGDFQGEKRAFGEVFENLGAGTHTLAEAFPALEGTWVGNFGSRGAAGLAADIVFDPLTYMTFGASALGKIKVGGKWLSKAGVDEFGRVLRKHTSALRETEVYRIADDVGKTRLGDRALIDAEKEWVSTFGDKVPKEFLTPGGAQIFKQQIPGSEHLGPAMRRALSMLPESVTKPAVTTAVKMRDGMQKSLRNVFSPEGALANLPEPLRGRAVRLTNSFFRASTAHRTRLMNDMDPLQTAYRKLERVDPKIGERWHDVREGFLPKSELKRPGELELFEQTMRLYDQMGETLVEHGVLTNEQIIRNYIHHGWKNLDDLQMYHPRTAGKVQPSEGVTRIEKERPFRTMREGVEISQRKHKQALEAKKLGKGDARPYPELIPEWDVFKNMKHYIDLHGTAVARKAWQEEMLAQFGKTLDDFDAFYDDVAVKPTKVPGAPKEFNPERVTLKRVIKEGDVEESLRNTFGPEGAQYIAVKNKFTNNELAYLPKAIANQLDNMHASIINTKDYPALGQMIGFTDWMNNNFKWGVYTLWPASATRDGYSNLFLAGLRVGINAIDPTLHRDAIQMMLGRNMDKVVRGTTKTRRELMESAKTFGVMVPGRVFVEETGKFKLGKFRKILTDKRAGIENEARLMLYLDDIRHGVPERLAADTVGEFLFNYGEVSRIERDLFRRLIPFYTFTRKNVERQWKSLRSTPGRVINQVKPFRGQDAENEQMVQWEAEGLKLRMDKDGKTVHMLTGIDLPLRNLDTLWRGDFQRTGRGMMGMITPIFKVWPEFLLNQDFFLGRDLTRTESGMVGRMIETLPTPKPVKDWLGYKKKPDAAGRPRYTFDGKRFTLLFRSWMFSRAISTSDRQFRDNMGKGGFEWQRMALDVLTGIRRKDIDLDEEMRHRLNNRIRQLEESLARRGVNDTFEKRFRSKRPAEFQ